MIDNLIYDPKKIWTNLELYFERYDFFFNLGIFWNFSDFFMNLIRFVLN